MTPEALTPEAPTPEAPTADAPTADAPLGSGAPLPTVTAAPRRWRHRFSTALVAYAATTAVTGVAPASAGITAG